MTTHPSEKRRRFIQIKRSKSKFKLNYLIAFYKTMEEKPFLKRMFSSNGNIKVFSIYRIYNGGNILSHFDFIPESLLRLGNKILRVIE